MATRRPARRVIPDVLAPGLRVVFCGINPGRMSAAAHMHFANPRNDFWRLIHAAGFTPQLMTPAEQRELMGHGCGITNSAHRPTAALRPALIAFVGKEAYRGAFGERPTLGLQKRRLGDTRLFVLPSTSPANAAVPWDERLRWFRELRDLAAPGRS